MDAASYMQRIKAMVWLIASAFTVALLAGCVLRSEAAAPLCYGTDFQPFEGHDPVATLTARCTVHHNTSYPFISYSVNADAIEDPVFVDVEYVCTNGSSSLSELQDTASVKQLIGQGLTFELRELVNETGAVCVFYGCLKVLGERSELSYRMTNSPVTIRCPGEDGDCERVHNCSAHANCTGTPGNYSCVCQPGFTGDGYTCTVEDEVCVHRHNCSAHANCTGTPGNYSCVCQPGFTGDGYTCTVIEPPAKNCSPAQPGCVHPNGSTSDVGSGTSPEDQLSPSLGSTATAQPTMSLPTGTSKLPVEWVATAVSLATLFVLSVMASLLIVTLRRLKKTSQRRKRRAQHYQLIFRNGIWDEIDPNYNPVSTEQNPILRCSPSVSIFEALEKWDKTADSDKKEECSTYEEDSYTLASGTAMSNTSESSGFAEHLELQQNDDTIMIDSGVLPKVEAVSPNEQLLVNQQDSCVSFSLAHSSGISSRQSSCDGSSLASSSKDEEEDTLESLYSAVREKLVSCDGYVTNVELVSETNTSVEQSSAGCLSTEGCIPTEEYEFSNGAPFSAHHDTTGSSGYGSEYTGAADSSTHHHDNSCETFPPSETTGTHGSASECSTTSQSEEFLFVHGPCSDSGQLGECHVHSTEMAINKFINTGDYVSSEHLFLRFPESASILRLTSPEMPSKMSTLYGNPRTSCEEQAKDSHSH